MNEDNLGYDGIVDTLDTVVDKQPSPVPNNPYDLIVDDLDGGRQQREQAQLRANMDWAKEQNPDLQAQVMRAADSVGLPRGAVPFLGDDFLERTRRDELVKAIDGAPVLKELLGDRSFLSLAQDDLPAMIALEGQVNKLQRNIDRFGTLEPANDRIFLPDPLRYAANAGTALDVGVSQMHRGVAGINASIAEMLGLDDLAARYRAAGADVGREMAATRSQLAARSQTELSIYSGIESTPTTVAAGIVTAMGQPELAVGLLSAVTGGDAYLQAREQGLSDLDARVLGMQQAVAEGLTEALPIGVVARPFKRWAANLTAEAPIFSTIAKAMIAENIGEQGATLWQGFNEWAMLHPTSPLSDYSAQIGNNALETLIATSAMTLVTMGMGAGGAAVLSAVEGRQERPISTRDMSNMMHALVALDPSGKLEKVRDAQSKALALGEIMSTAAQAKLRERDPEGFAQAVQRMADQAGTPDVYIDAQAFAQIVEKGRDRLTEAAPQLATVIGQLPEALAAGGDVRIPVGTLVSAMSGTGLEQDIVDNVRATPDGLSAAQVKELDQGAVMAEMQKQAQAVFELQQNNDAFMQSADVVHKHIVDQLNQVKRFTETVNASYAELVRNFYAVQANRLGVTPEELFARYPLQIAGAIDQGAQGLSQGDEHGPFGPVLRGFARDAKGAVAKLREMQAGEALGALHHPAVGDIDLVWGEEGTGSSDGYGLAKIIKYHPEVVDDLQGALDHMIEVSRTANRVQLESADHRAGVRLEWDEYAKTWLLTAFRQDKQKAREATRGDKSESGGPSESVRDATTDTASTTVGDDTARPDGTLDTNIEQAPLDLKSLRQGGAAPRGFYTPTARRISLLQNANLSTFLHETGHFFLDVYEDMAARPDAPAEIVKDMQTLLDWFGVADLDTWRKMSLKEKRPYHERFAEGFEAYLFKGEAPNVEMQGLFSKFRAWLIAVYKNLKQTFSPEVRAVVDRMIASDMQIAQAEAVRNMAPIFATAEQAGMTAEEFADYHALADRATEAAQATLRKRNLADMKWMAEAKAKALREVGKDVKLKRAEVEAEVRDEVLRQPVYAAMRLMSHGEMPPGLVPTNKAERRAADEMSVIAGNKLSLDTLKEMYGEGPAAPWRYLPTGKTGLATAKGGVHPDVIAHLFGFASGDELVREILSAEKMSDLIEGMTDQRMLERYGDISSPEAMERAAEEAIHNEARARFIAAELSALQKANDAKVQTGANRNGVKVSTNALVLAAKKLAADIVARTTVKDLKPAQYAAAEARNAKQTYAAMAEGDIVKAATAKRQQLISHQTTAQALKAQSDVQKGVRYLAKFAKDKARQNIDPEYVEQIFNLLERYDLRKSTTGKQMERRQSLLEWYNAQLAQGQQPIIPASLINDARRISYKQMTVAEFRDLVDTIKNIEHLGRLKKRLLTAKDGREWDAIKADIVTSLADNQTTERRTYTEDGWRARAADLWNGFLALHRKAASLVYEMDGFKDGGVLWEYFVRPMNERGALEASMREKATIDLSRILKPILRKGGLGGKRSYYAAIGKSLTREQLLAVALNRGNEGNLQRLMDGGVKGTGPLTVDQIDRLLADVTVEEWKVVQKIWDYFESYRPQIAEKERRVTGVEPEWIDPAPFQTPHGTMRGGYYPIKYDAKASKKAEQHADAEAARAQMAAAYTSATTRRSFTKNRVETVTGRPLLLNFSGIYQGLNEVIHDLAWHEWLIDANRILRNEDIDRRIRSGWGPETVRALTSAVDDIARGDVGAQNEFEKVINHLRTGATVAGLGWNLTTSLLQPIGLTQSIVRVGAPWVAKGLTRWMKNPMATIEEIHGKSEFMRLRGKTMQREINEVANLVKGQSAGGALFQTSLFYLIQKFQAIADVPTWLGAYEKAIANNESEERAVALADQAVVDAQGGGQQKDLAAIQRGGPLMKLFTNFYSFFNTTWNLAVERTKATAAKPSPQAVAGLAVDYALLFTVPAIAGEVMRILLDVSLGGEPPDEEEVAKRLAAAQVSYLLGTLVGLREVGGAFGGAMGYSGPAGNRFFASLTDFGKQVAQGDLDRPLVKKATDVVGILAHLPSGQINRSVDGIMALIEGDTVNPAAILLGAPR